ncbi:selenocysteine-specific translation elongation factor [Amycolatopsis sp. NPDC049253]|uniref:selenocysteine-specific translation elongation factor n=1 Tax=Amycolatopsis sp. NPDC049253 TaxID=3155274 RepID=UPI0034440473
MRVIATAGHVDHGKSTLVRRLTGMEPDRWAEERRRGLTIDLGFAWTRIGGEDVAFVDVPGHERFVPNMLAGAGPVPAVVFVVAADEGWKPQSAEHLAALDAFGVDRGLLVVTKADRAEPGPATAAALHEFSPTSLGSVPSVAVSGTTGAGFDELRAALGELVATLPVPDAQADVRLWLDRAFTVRGAGTVVTGTLAAGTISTGDELDLGGVIVTVKGIEALGEPRDRVTGVARVAVNLRGVAREQARRGDALLTPGAWLTTTEADVRVRGTRSADLHQSLVLHLGTAAVAARVRPLGTDTARLTLRTPLPLRVGDRGLVRDPGAHVIPAGVEVLDVRPPELRRRGAARARGDELTREPAPAHLERRGFVRATEFRAMGFAPTGERVGEWLVDPARFAHLKALVGEEVAAWTRDRPVAAGMPEETLRRRLELPAQELLPPLLTGLETRDGLVRLPGTGLEPRVAEAVAELEAEFAEHPFRAPGTDHLRELGLGRRELAAAVRHGRLTLLAEGVYVAPGIEERAAAVLPGLAQPFTVADARRALDTTRRVMVPLLERLDAAGVTEPLGDGTRRVR